MAPPSKCQYRHLVLIILVGLWHTASSMATTVVLIFNPEGIVIGADSKSTQLGGNFDVVGSRNVEKITIVQDRIAIADVGLNRAVIRRRVRYDFASFLADIIAELPVNVSVSELAAIVELKSGEAFSDYSNTVIKTHNIVRPNPALEQCRPLVQYVIAGYENGKPTIFVVHVNIDWHRETVDAPIKTLVYPLEGETVDFGVLTVGNNEAIKSFANPKSYAYKQALSRAPIAFKKLVAHDHLTLTEAQRLSRVLISIEEQVDPDQVGGNISVVVITKKEGKAVPLTKARPAPPCHGSEHNLPNCVR